MSEYTTDQRLRGLATLWQTFHFPSDDLPEFVAYLTGTNSADRFLGPAPEDTPGRWYYLGRVLYLLLIGPRQRLGRFDERVLDLCTVAPPSRAQSWLDIYFSYTGMEGPVAEAWDYLRSRGVDEAAIRRAALWALGEGLGHRRDTMPIGVWVSARMLALWPVASSRWRPEHLEGDLAWSVADRVGWRRDDGEVAALGALALRLDPPAVEFAWRVARMPSTFAGYLAGLLLAHDPARFGAWTRALALDPVAAFAAAGLGAPDADGREVKQTRIDALGALAHVDPAQHMPLVETFIPDRSKGAPREWEDIGVVAVELAYEHDPGRHRRQLEKLLGSKSLLKHQWMHVMRWLEAMPEQQGRPLLEYAVWHGANPFARAALDALLGREGDDASAFVATLLAHRSKQIRASATTWLAKHGEQAG